MACALLCAVQQCVSTRWVVKLCILRIKSLALRLLERIGHDSTAHAQKRRPRDRRRPAHGPEGLPDACARRRRTPASCSAASILPQPVDIRADAYAVGDTRLSSCLERDGVKVATVEHLMSAFAGLGIDNAYVDLTAAEVPIMDGSAGPFVFLLQSAGIEEQTAAKRFIRVLKTVEVSDGDKWARFEPYDGFQLDFTIDFNHPVFEQSSQRVAGRFRDHVLREGSRARAHLRLHAGRGDACAHRASAWAAASTTRS